MQLEMPETVIGFSPLLPPPSLCLCTAPTVRGFTNTKLLEVFGKQKIKCKFAVVPNFAFL